MTDARPSLGSRLVEALTLRQATALAAHCPASTREATAAALALGRQRAAAAETLWVAGHGAEALATARRGLDATLDGASSALRHGLAEGRTPSVPPGEETWSPLLRQRLSREALDALFAVRSELGSLPLLDGAVSANHARLFRRIQQSRESVDAALVPLERTPGEVRGIARRRLAVLALGLAGVVALIALAFGPPSLSSTVTESGVYQGDPRYAGEKAFDGDPRTEWTLDDRSRGWVERRFHEPVAMGAIVLHNGHNGSWMDRGVRGYRVELYDAEGNEVHRFRDAFRGIEEGGPVKRHSLPALRPVGLLRVVVESYFDMGASLAEVSWDAPVPGQLGTPAADAAAAPPSDAGAADADAGEGANAGDPEDNESDADEAPTPPRSQTVPNPGEGTENRQ